MRRLNQGWRRQAPVGPYIVDFVRHEVGLIVEVDGPVHGFPGRAEQDANRQRWLETQGYAVMRLADDLVRNHPDRAVERVLAVSARFRPSATRRGEARDQLR